MGFMRIHFCCLKQKSETTSQIKCTYNWTGKWPKFFPSKRLSATDFKSCFSCEPENIFDIPLSALFFFFFLLRHFFRTCVLNFNSGQRLLFLKTLIENKKKAPIAIREIYTDINQFMMSSVKDCDVYCLDEPKSFLW